MAINIRKSVAWALVSIASSSAIAAGQEDVVVVTASATEQNLKDAPASISVITQDDLKKKPVQNLKDVLKDVPGIQLTNEADNRKGVSIRGLGSEYTLILIDGKRVSSRTAVFRHNDFDLNWIPVDAIERIEVVRGPMSSLYGSDALGGVVNIITRKVGKAWHGTVSVDSTVQEHRDRGDSYNGNFFTSGPLVDDVLGVKMYGNLGKREKDDAQRSSTAQGGTAGRIEGYTNRNGNVEFALVPAENQDMTLGYGYDRQDRDSDSLNKNRLDRKNYSVGHNGKWDFGNTEIRLYGDKIDNYNERLITAKNNSVDGKVVLPLSSINQMLTFGGEWRQEKLQDSVNLTGSGHSAATQRALFVENEWRIFEPLALTTGIRMDDHQKYGDHWSPRVYLVYNATDTVTLKGGWANAFKAPSLLQLSPEWQTGSCRGDCQVIGNPNLKPETSENVELGIYYAGEEGWLEGINASLTVFQNDVNDMITVNRTRSVTEAQSYPNYAGLTSDGKPIFRYYNVNKARVRGVETELKVPVSEQVNLTLNYTYNDGRDLSSGASKPLSSLPLHTANSSLDWKPVDDWSFYLSANYSGQRRATTSTSKTSGGYTLWDIGTAYQMTKAIKWRAGVQNLMDKDLNYDDYSFNEEGRRYFIAMDYTF
ncbi:catecholate siderophore receptor CirA [Pectobacterium versatile]|uniref:catecholate siderophore receptor CirA n=1 Tax=Pectobacterium versatile TaxID=2488639 RepID=UPI001CCF7FF5|nr:catecholate siderophore receptor CirA [Pectobacterium versatile]GKW02361.1 catecholate siderophore receptor CirA [Pectobacterium carotovorum subsp. carotovorum]GKX43949.1 catecholate siderophore receptor CirA [Pectobacterium carotovorum subsp. carotovorum]GLX56048.1 catecholate siderophore receptor CirA [Pectobacterium carotovorum subsp. carotovorum]